MTHKIDQGRDPALRRMAPRFKVFQPAALAWGGASHRAHILDLSARGARLHCAKTPPAGTLLALHCREVTVCGRIVWSKEDRFGVEFQIPLPDGEVRRIIEGAAG